VERAFAYPQVILRPEYHQWGFVGANPTAFDAILIPARYRAGFPEGHRRHGGDHDGLVEAAVKAGSPRYDDPGTPALCSKGVVKYASALRLTQTPAARAVTLPLRPESLRDAGRRNAFVDAAVQDQVGSATLAAPYLDARNIRDERHGLNVLMTRRVVASTADQIPAAFIQGTRHALLSGTLAAMAGDYASTGVRRVFLRVRGLKPEHADRDEFLAYLDLIEALKARGVEAVADCSGRLGPALVAGGAFAFSLGTQFFRSVSAPLLSAGGGGGGTPLGEETVGAWSEQPREDGADLDRVRANNLNEFRRLAALAASDPAALIDEMRSSGNRYAIVWAAVLIDRRARAA
jgi:hypothetical protein